MFAFQGTGGVETHTTNNTTVVPSYLRTECSQQFASYSTSVLLSPEQIDGDTDVIDLSLHVPSNCWCEIERTITVYSEEPEESIILWWDFGDDDPCIGETTIRLENDGELIFSAIDSGDITTTDSLLLSSGDFEIELHNAFEGCWVIYEISIYIFGCTSGSLSGGAPSITPKGG